MNLSPLKPLHVLGLAIALTLGAIPAFAQEDHSMHQPPPKTAPATKKPVAKKAATKKAVVQKPSPAPVKKTQAADPHAGHAIPSPTAKSAAAQPATVDHAAMGHAMPPQQEPEPAQETDHAAMGHDVPAEAKPAEPIDHAAMGHEMPAPQPEPAEEVDHAAMGHAMPPPPEPAQAVDHAAMGHDMASGENAAMDPDLPATAAPIDPIPTLTEADRAAAFPDVAGHAVHDTAIHSFWLLDRLEGWNADEGAGVAWEAMSWIGTDLDRVWLRSEGERVDGSTESADIEVLYGRAIAPWWDVVAGVRHDFGEGPSQTFAAIGVQGLAPYKYEVEATAYIGQSGQTAARFEAEYETLVTNRLILQWLGEAEFHGKDDARRGIGSGLGTVEAGLRLRYEFSRQFAPYIGVVWERAFGGTADLRREEFDDIDDTRFVAGVRIWF